MTYLRDIMVYNGNVMFKTTMSMASEYPSAAIDTC
jgi:hypothetical protein